MQTIHLLWSPKCKWIEEAVSQLTATGMNNGDPPEGLFNYASIIGMLGYLQANSCLDITLLSVHQRGSSILQEALTKKLSKELVIISKELFTKVWFCAWHYAVKLHWFQSKLDSDGPHPIVIVTITTDIQRADIFTKGLLQVKFQAICNAICLRGGVKV
ncbi:hypothetical protein IV203_038299 [Nitzschia inconspicua]|uniref:Uncharacterized protein n=1 Tax=Nitzschia inconspicua TaxID=303405 RepID=A0A9K3PZD2_9STRA|nr:hypothetical protein IV203_038299 [Nitzschia inconspicua]